jgi:hypothetical protein
MRYEILIENWWPPSANDFRGRHWSAERKAKKEAYDFISTYVRNLGGVPAARGRRRVTLVRVLGPRQRGRDTDNEQKALRDALRAAGVIVNDDPRWLVFPEPLTERGARRATRLIIEDIEPEPRPRRGRASKGSA